MKNNFCMKKFPKLLSMAITLFLFVLTFIFTIIIFSSCIFEDKLLINNIIKNISTDVSVGK